MTTNLKTDDLHLTQEGIRTRLLISVRNVDEARIAHAEHADIIDVKEPLNGPLGAANFATLKEIGDEFQGVVTLSAALGELTETESLTGRVPNTFSYAKLGLAGAATIDWRQQLRKRFAELPSTVKPVAVIYGDWRSCNAPRPEEILDAARTLDYAAILFDTFEKEGRSLFDFLPVQRLSKLLDCANAFQLITVIAGCITKESLPDAASLKPDFVAVRGAACDGTREGNINANAIRELQKLLCN